METALEAPSIDFGPSKFGVELRVNPEGVPNGEFAVVDVETDEDSHFVGIGIMCDPVSVSYYSVLRPDVVEFLGRVPLVGHNLKFDSRSLKSWGVDIKAQNLIHDTMLMSYVRNSTKESHGLKELAKEYLAMEWPTYNDMVGIGKGKTTLDKLPVNEVAAYCGCDCVATMRLKWYFDKTMTPLQKGYYGQIELPMMQLLFDMEQIGVTVDVERLKKLREDFGQDEVMLLKNLRTLVADRGYAPGCTKSCPKKAHNHEFNPNSVPQVLAALKSFGLPVMGTAKADVEPYRADEFVNMLMEYRKISKVIGTFIDAWLELPTLPKIHTTFSQVSFDENSGDWKGIRTGRLSSKEPNLQQISKAGGEDEETTGKALRSAFIPAPGTERLVLDYDQFQYRILAHYTQEKVLLEAFRRGEDVHEATGKVLFQKETISKLERAIAKNCNFGAVFGAQAEKIAETARCSVEEAKKFLATYWKRLPGVTHWIERTKMLAHVHKSVKTLFGRVIPLPDIDSRNMFDRLHADRTAVNYIIQGGEADIIKVGMLKVRKAGYMPILQVHDELHFDVKPKDCIEALLNIKGILETVVKLDVPILVNGGYGDSWFNAK